MRKYILCILLIALMMTGCQAAIQTPVPDLKTPIPGAYDPLMLTPSPPVEGPGASEYPPGVSAARAALADGLSLPVDAVGVVLFEPHQWPDSCLGLGAPDEVCAQGLVDGFYVVLQAADGMYEYRTDTLGAVVRPLVQIGELPAAAEAARSALADLLRIPDPLAISVVGIQAEDWPNACLGLEPPGVACAEVITPGYRVSLLAQGVRFEYYTDAPGDRVLPAGALAGPFGQVSLILRSGQGAENCQILHLAANGAAYGACGGELESSAFPNPQRTNETTTWVERYAPVEADTAAGRLVFFGRGQLPAGEHTRRALAAWAKAAVEDARGTPAPPDQGYLLRWVRSGGLAGLCDELRLYESGWVYVSNCREDPPQPYGQLLLDASQLELLFGWVDGFARLQTTRSDDFPDGFQFDLTLNFRGDEPFEASQMDEVFAFVDQLFTAAVP